VERDYLLIFLAFSTMIEADRHTEAVQACPALDEQKIGDLECDTFRCAGRSGGNAAPRQIAHNPPNTGTRPTAIVKALTTLPIAASAAAEPFCSGPVGRIGAPCN